MSDYEDILSNGLERNHFSIESRNAGAWDSNKTRQKGQGEYGLSLQIAVTFFTSSWRFSAVTFALKGFCVGWSRGGLFGDFNVLPLALRGKDEDFGDVLRPSTRGIFQISENKEDGWQNESSVHAYEIDKNLSWTARAISHRLFLSFFLSFLAFF